MGTSLNGTPLPPEERKRHLAIRLPREVVAYYAATGPGWRTRIGRDLSVLVKWRLKRKQRDTRGCNVSR
jgi:uncharacterized protein (DUF4415 family)